MIHANPVQFGPAQFGSAQFGTRGAVAMPRRIAPAAWARVALATAFCSGVAVAALPSAEPDAPEAFQWQALSVAPLSAGGRTGIRLTATDAVEPIDVAPERAQVALTLTLSRGDNLVALLRRAGASASDAAQAVATIGPIAASPTGATNVAVTLGAKSGSARRIERVALRSGISFDVELKRGADGALTLIKTPLAVDTTPLRVRGRAGDGMYWALRAAGVTPRSAAEYLQALATEIDVGSEISPDDRFDLVISSRRLGSGEAQVGPLLYAGIDRAGGDDLQLVKWSTSGRANWINAASLDSPRETSAGMAWPVAGRITSGFGYRVHPILRFARLHRGVDFGAGWGSPIHAAADGQVTRAGWAGGYGRQVRLAHGGGLATSYSHMSQIVAEPGSFVRRGQLIGYVGSSGLSTGPHLHYEVYRNGTAVNPLGVRFSSVAMVDTRQVNAIKARLKALLSVGTRG